MAGKTQGWKLDRNPRTGIYQVRFRVGGKRYHRSTGKTDRAKAQSAAARLVRRVTEGDRRDHAAPDVPLPELIGSWLAGVRTAVSPETARTWELYAGSHFITHFRTTEGLCSESRLREYMRVRLGVVKARTVQKELSALRSLFAWMVERGCGARSRSRSRPRFQGQAVRLPSQRRDRAHGALRQPSRRRLPTRTPARHHHQPVRSCEASRGRVRPFGTTFGTNRR